MINVNAHLHTPYSFSAFRDIDEALDRAVAENVSVVGINDFYTAKGYEAWALGCQKRKLYPLFGIEFISLNEADQKAGLRVNDPANPGRTYLSGKGMSYPFRLGEPYATLLSSVQTESNRQVEAMCAKLNEHLREKNASFLLDVEQIKQDLTSGSIRERHLARALRMKVYEVCHNEEAAIQSLLTKLFDGKALKSSVNDIAAVENEIRGNLLKAGGAAFVPEEVTAFLPMEQVQKMIVAAGGIPTYPFLADDAQGNYTDFESDMERVADQLTERGFIRWNLSLLATVWSYWRDMLPICMTVALWLPLAANTIHPPWSHRAVCTSWCSANRPAETDKLRRRLSDCCASACRFTGTGGLCGYQRKCRSFKKR